MRLGDWWYREGTGQLEPVPCEDRYGNGSVRYRIARFRLMRTEVTNGLYETCVRAGVCEPPGGDLSLDPEPLGAWDNPGRRDKPVAATYPQARRFCQAYGGDLPTYPQWIRALEGDEGAFGIGSLTSAALACLMTGVGSLCAEMDRAPWSVRLPAARRDESPYRTISPVDTFAWDRGPYGHAGMFAGAAEWVRMFPHDLRCASEGANGDVPYVGRPDPEIGALLNDMQSAMDLWWGEPFEEKFRIAHGSVLGTSGDDLDTRPRMGGPAWYWNGFRCAFPP